MGFLVSDKSEEELSFDGIVLQLRPSEKYISRQLLLAVSRLCVFYAHFFALFYVGRLAAATCDLHFIWDIHAAAASVATCPPPRTPACLPACPPARPPR